MKGHERPPFKVWIAIIAAMAVGILACWSFSWLMVHFLGLAGAVLTVVFTFLAGGEIGRRLTRKILDQETEGG